MFTIMTWNVENLFQPDAPHRSNFDAKLDALVGIITDAAPDLLALQEVGDEESFEDLRARLGSAWMGHLSTHFEPSHGGQCFLLCQPGKRVFPG